MSAAPTACPSCGDEVAPGARFCEGCGTPLADVPPGTTPGPPATPTEDLGSGPISAPTQIRPVSAAPTAQAGRRPCLSCGGVVGPDYYCEQCGTKQPTERDHFRENPAPWVAGVCDRGIRHAHNEDAMALLATPASGERAVLVVLDGVSNTYDSDQASLAGARAAREVLRTPLPRGMGTPESRRSAVTRVLSDAVSAANDAVVGFTPDGSEHPPSATFVAAVIERGVLTCANLGDSRAYWLPDGGSGVQLSEDDSAAQAQIAAGVPRLEAEASAMAHAITRWLGKDAPDLTPHVVEHTIEGPGWVLVCSDGLWNYASEPEALRAQIAAAGASEPASLALALTDFANAQGGQDNITVALARVAGPAPAPEAGQNAGAQHHPADNREQRESDG